MKEEVLIRERMPTKMSKTEREAWFAKHIPTPIQLLLNQPFGKANHKQTFYSEVTLRHVVPHLYRSGFLSNRAKKSFEAGFYPAKTYSQLWRRYRPIDFRPLQQPNLQWESEMEINQE